MKPRPIRVDGDVAYVPLTRGYEAVIDAGDVSAVGEWAWSADVQKHTVYAARKDRTGPRLVKVYMHRLLLGFPAGAIDHRDGDGLNNRRAGDTGNIRIASPSQNNHNQRLSRRNKSGIKGVSWSEERKKWVAAISLNRKRIMLGRYLDIADAAAAYAAASAKLHGKFGRTS